MSRVDLIASIVLCLAATVSVSAQHNPTMETSALCTRDNAVETAKQQIIMSRTLDNVAQRVSVLVRAGDLLWPHEQEKANAAFMEAFELAVQHFKEVGDQTIRTSQNQFAARISLPDQRFKVITAIAKHDPVMARKLSEQMLKDEARDAAEKPKADDQSKRMVSEKLLALARELIGTDLTWSVNFARNSLKYPATLSLPSFLYELSKKNKAAADQFYLEALAAYPAAPMDQFLYLSSYPFGNSKEAGEMPGYTIYNVPGDFVRTPALQRQFVQALLARIEGAMAMPAEESANSRYSEHAQMWMALNRLEKHIQTELPDLFDPAMRSRDKLFSLLAPNAQKRVTGVINADNVPKQSFDEKIEAAEKLTDVDKRDQMLTFAVMDGSKDQPLEKVIGLVDKISDSNIRGPLLNWVYYFLAQARIGEKNLVEARKLASKVTELDQRAYLFTRIAEESLKQAEDQSEARQLLDEIGESVRKAPKTIVSARAFLALAYLYSKIDTNRGVEELSNAVRTVNALESPDFSRQFVMMKIEGKNFGSYAAYSTPGFNPENAFREMGKLDFDGSLVQAANFTDKSLRALTTLSVIEPCFATKSPKTRK